MNVTDSAASDQHPSPCDRVAFYACTTDPNRPTREMPVRAGATIPARYTDHAGRDWVLLSYVTPRPGESIDEAIVRETRELDDLIADVTAEALAQEPR